MGRRRKMREALYTDRDRLQGLVWSAFPCVGDEWWDAVIVCVRSRVDCTGAVRELSREAAEAIAESGAAQRLLKAELEGELCEASVGEVGRAGVWWGAVVKPER